MATLIAGERGPDLGLNWLNPGDVDSGGFDIGFIFYTAWLEPPTPTFARGDLSSIGLPNVVYEFYGTGMTYDAGGVPIGGTVNRLVTIDSGVTVFDLRDINMPLSQFVPLVNQGAQSGNNNAANSVFKGTVLGVADTLIGSSGPDLLAGWGGKDVVNGNGGNDHLRGDGGDDMLSGGTGSDLLNGGYGFDTAVIGASRANATVTRANGEVVITSADGTDVLRGVERAQFSDQALLLASNADASGVDFSGDGRADILWRSTGDAVALWTMSGTMLTGAAVIANASQYWTLAASGDFNADGKADILWRGEAGEVALWTLNGFQLSGAGVIATASPYWSIAGSGDFNGDAKADILWRGEGGEVALWAMNGFQLTSAGVIGTPSPYWTITGIGDFNGDRTDDILWRGGNNEVALWTMSAGQAIDDRAVATTSAYWTIADTADFSADGKADILWRGANGDVALWTMDGPQLAGARIVAGAGVAPLYWTIADAGDFNGDGRADILWRGDAGDLAEWTNIGTDFSAAVLAAAPSYDWLIG